LAPVRPEKHRYISVGTLLTLLSLGSGFNELGFKLFTVPTPRRVELNQPDILTFLIGKVTRTEINDRSVAIKLRLWALAGQDGPPEGNEKSKEHLKKKLRFLIS